jgi:PAS domain S-box-containing protein
MIAAASTLEGPPMSNSHRQKLSNVADPLGIGTLVARLRDAVLIAESATDRIVFANQAAERMFGLPAAGLLGHPLSDRVAVPDGDRAARLADGQAFEAVGRRASGEPFPAELTLTDLEAEQPPGAFVAAVIRDLTERKRVDTQAHAAQEARLLESETQLQAIIQQATDGIWIKDLEGRHVLINPAGAAIAGRPVEDVLGRKDEELYPREVIAQIRDRDRRVIATGVSETYEIAIQHPTKGPRTYFSVKFPYRLPDGRIQGIVVITRDITERKQLEQAVREQLEALKELDRLKTDFVNAVSHELRTPLTTIRGYVEFLEEGVGGALGPQPLEFVGEIDLATARLTRLVDDLLDFARIQAGSFEIRRERFDLREKLFEVAGSLRPQVNRAQLSLEVQVSEALCVAGDPERLGQVLTNLAANAIKFTPPGGRIVIRARRDGGDIVCEVEDTGEGIAPEDQPKLFQKFAQLKAGKAKGGTGLGLSISKVIVEAHGGQIGMRSAAGGGSVFWFRLPAGE